MVALAAGEQQRYPPRTMNRTRVIAAFLLSPFAAALYLLGLVFLFDNPVPTHISELLAIVVLFAIIGFVAEFVLGIPLLLLFRYFSSDETLLVLTRRFRNRRNPFRFLRSACVSNQMGAYVLRCSRYAQHGGILVSGLVGG